MDEDTRAIVPLESIAPSEAEASAELAVRPAEQLAADRCQQSFHDITWG